jgi:hypothetical protein
MAQCNTCGEYTKFEGGLCYDCYKENPSNKQKHTYLKDDELNVPKENSWVYNLIKSRIAETIIEELFQTLNFQVFRYGMENTIPGIKELLKGVKDEVALEIKRMPDFVVFKGGKAHFIEVKFRKNESFKLKDIEEQGEYPYENALIVLVSKNILNVFLFKSSKMEMK